LSNVHVMQTCIFSVSYSRGNHDRSSGTNCRLEEKWRRNWNERRFFANSRRFIGWWGWGWCGVCVWSV